MSDNYDSRTASHYAAFRPPLHQLILSDAVADLPKFTLGLDIGCGIGHSSIALKSQCASVIGIEPSDAMLTLAIEQKPTDIRYIKGTGDAIPIESDTIDIVTFAGSLFYAKSDKLTHELKRVCRPNAIVVAYDFEVILEQTLLMLGVVLERPVCDYNHTINFSGCSGFSEIAVVAKEIKLHVTAEELAHILLSSTRRYGVLTGRFGENRLHEKLANKIKQESSSPHILVNTYYSTYRL
ncbi:class I SAM-dependent methyltransferase [Enterovibrio nigricans]|uniref:Methyltransferase domain-containing protein n=1 Tax=Enterovibrio nigricans DSM 22720 TaxID=1121868 RepID=A0A1T4V4W2_9GAMM|nr:class I SAM-dependent methyltransferase [Enterovibrio nigricans]PKF50476.1 class I SAM-dependent methyltransferase [Enterovibrio nigricans]SKA59944.1 Methyltransferase domain-containing protein [Enterovibrio nigricans DSM 22720]